MQARLRFGAKRVLLSGRAHLFGKWDAVRAFLSWRLSIGRRGYGARVLSSDRALLLSAVLGVLS